MEGTLSRAGFVRLGYRLGREAATGRLVLDESPPAVARHELYVRRGYLTFADVAGVEARLGELLVEAGADADAVARALEKPGLRLAGHALRAAGAVSDSALEAGLRRQAELKLARLAAMPGASWRFEAGATAPPAHRSGRPVALTTWARQHVEAGFDSARARHFAAELGTERLILRKDLAPDPADGDDTDRRILAALAAPRRLEEIARVAAAPMRRLLSFLAFLHDVGALEVPRPSAPIAAARVLGLAADADAAAVKQAYRRAARRLHPDMHPGLGVEGRRALETEFAAVASAYRTLTRIP